MVNVCPEIAAVVDTGKDPIELAWEEMQCHANTIDRRAFHRKAARFQIENTKIAFRRGVAATGHPGRGRHHGHFAELGQHRAQSGETDGIDAIVVCEQDPHCLQDSARSIGAFL